MPRSRNVLLISFLVLPFASVLSASVLADGPVRPATDQTIGVELTDVNELRRSPVPPMDPPGVLKEPQLAPVVDLAARLSRDRSWLTPEVLKVLGERALGLDEIFEKAPRYVSVDGALYRIKLEKVGDRWSGFAAERNPFVIFLTHEVYDGLGNDRALGYEAGEEVILFASDFERLPALALTFFRLTQDERPDAGERVAVLHAEKAIVLGEPLSAITFKPDVSSASEFHRVVAKSHCAGEVAPIGCSGTKILCPVDYQPYFILSGLKAFVNHEECCFHGDPEIEIYPLRIDATSGVDGTTNATTRFVFSGRTIVDIAGRTRFLPDVDDGGSLFSMNVALIPTNMTSQFVGLMVEDDDEPGRLKLDNKKLNVSKLLTSGLQIIQDSRNMDRFFMIKALASLLDILGLLPNSDDLFQPSLGATNNLFCTNALGGPFPKVFTMSSSQWEMRGYFACVNATCEDGGGGGGGGGGCVADCPPPPL